MLRLIVDLVLLGLVVLLVGFIVDKLLKSVHKKMDKDSELDNIYEDATELMNKKEEISEKVAQKEERLCDIKEKLKN